MTVEVFEVFEMFSGIYLFLLSEESLVRQIGLPYSHDHPKNVNTECFGISSHKIALIFPEIKQFQRYLHLRIHSLTQKNYIINNENCSV